MLTLQPYLLHWYRYPRDIFKISLYLSISYGYPLYMEIKLKLRKIGNSIMIAIPSQVVNDLKLKVGNEMLLDIKGTTILIRKSGT